jgi:hypothetical protein
MTITDYVLDIGLISLVLLQVRGRRLTVRNMVLPFLIVGWAVDKYLSGVPTSGNDLLLVGVAVAGGALFGTVAGLFTTVRADGKGGIVAKAGLVAALAWVLGVGTRLAFQLYATNGGGAAIGRFSAAHHITGAEPWTAALILMALTEVVGRTVIIGARAYRVNQATGATLGRSAQGSPAGRRALLSTSDTGSQNGWQ